MADLISPVTARTLPNFDSGTIYGRATFRVCSTKIHPLLPRRSEVNFRLMTSEAAFEQNNRDATCALNSSLPVRATDQSTLAKFSRRPIFHVIVFLFAFLLIFSRRPDAILNAQFFAEDGQRWFADAYQRGWHCLVIPDQAGDISTLFPGFPPCCRYCSHSRERRWL
jgi:hypothetical protein